MDASVLLAIKVAASAFIGLLIGLEREWAHKEAGVRSFAIAALLGTLAWLVTPTLALVQIAGVLLVVLLVNMCAVWKEQSLQITTSLALAATNVLGILVGAENFFLAFTSAIVIAALLTWKTELITLSSKTTSNFMIGVVAAASAGIYFSRGDIPSLIAAPVALCILIGALVGARVLAHLSNSHGAA